MPTPGAASAGCSLRLRVTRKILGAYGSRTMVWPGWASFKRDCAVAAGRTSSDKEASAAVNLFMAAPSTVDSHKKVYTERPTLSRESVYLHGTAEPPQRGGIAPELAQNPTPDGRSNVGWGLVDLVGIEPTTSSMP